MTTRTRTLLLLASAIMTAAHSPSPGWAATGTARLGKDESKSSGLADSDRYGFAYLAKDSADTDTCATVDKNGSDTLTAQGGYGYVFDTDTYLLPLAIIGNEVVFTGRTSGNDCLYMVWGSWYRSGGASGGGSDYWTSQQDTRAYLICYVNDPYAADDDVIHSASQGTVWVELHNSADGASYAYDLTQSPDGGGVVSLDLELQNVPAVLAHNQVIVEGTASETIVYGANSGELVLTPQPSSTSAPATSRPTTAIVGQPTIIVSPNPIKTGYALSLTEGLQEGITVIPLTKIVTITCIAKAKAGSLTVALVGANASKAELGTLVRNTGNGTITVPVKGKDASTPTSITQLEVKDGTTQLGLYDIKVVVPRTQTHQVSNPTITNGAALNADATTLLVSVVHATATITIKDQYGQQLDTVYDGQKVVWEYFTGATGTILTGGGGNRWMAIRLPGSTMRNGSIPDGCTIRMKATINTALTVAEQAGWVAGTFMVLGGNNAFKISGRVSSGTGTQHIRVHGHILTNSFFRTMTAVAANHPPCPGTITDTVPQQ